MEKRKLFFVCAGVLSGAAALRSCYEIRHLKTSYYALSSKKLPQGTSKRIVFLSDLHAKSYGKKNIKLLRLVRDLKPDFIVLGGDMITASKGSASDDMQVMLFLNALKKTAPVYYAMGNHEEYLRTEKNRFANRFENIEAALEKYGIPLLKNGHIDLGDNISVYGLELSRKYYRRFNRAQPSPLQIKKLLGDPDKSRYNILLAHMPGFFDAYEAWKPDLVLSGHYHGGIIGIPCPGKDGQRKGLISPGFKILPDYCAGKFRKNNTDLIVSAGCGSHSINIRLFNRPEAVCIELSCEA